MSARPPSPPGRWRFHVGPGVVTVAPPVRVPPLPRPGIDRRPADWRPRTGPARARGRDGLPGRRVRGAGRGRRRPRRQHEPDRLPGGLHRPVVRRPGRRHDLPAHRQLRAAFRGRPVARPWLRGLVVANATAAVVDDARQLARCCATTASRRSPASTPGRWRATSGRTAACAGIVTEPGRSTAMRRSSAARGGAALGGPGLRRPRSRPPSITDVGRAEDGGPLVAIVDYGLKANIVRSLRRRGARVRVLPHTVAPADVLAPDIDGRGPLARPRRSGAARGPGRAGTGGDRRRAAAARDLPRAPDRRARRGRRDAPAPVRPPRREPPGPRHRHGVRPGDRPEPRGPGRRARRCRPTAAST